MSGNRGGIEIDTDPPDVAWVADLLPRVLPSSWRLACRAADGAKYLRGDGLSVIVSGAVELDGKRWLHVSCARANRLPSRDEMHAVKCLFVGRERVAVEVWPRESRYVDLHPYCLHLWHCLDGDPVPDFARGGATI